MCTGGRTLKTDAADHHVPLTNQNPAYREKDGVKGRVLTLGGIAQQVYVAVHWSGREWRP